MATRVNFQGAVRKIQRLRDVMKRPLRDLLDGRARILAIECARWSQPYGTGRDAQFTGQKAVARDISRVYGNANKAWEAIQNPLLKARFWQLYKDGEYDRAEEAAQEDGVNVGRFDGGEAHKRARNNRGRVSQRVPSIFIIHPSERKELQKYAEHKIDQVGFGKGGWADVVRALGGSSFRGLKVKDDISSSWISHKASGFGSASRGGTDEHPTVTITSRVPYAREILYGSGLGSAKVIAYDKFIAGLIGVKAELLREAGV